MDSHILQWLQTELPVEFSPMMNVSALRQAQATKMVRQRLDSWSANIAKKNVHAEEALEQLQKLPSDTQQLVATLWRMANGPGGGHSK